jgi:hypothetical protein
MIALSKYDLLSNPEYFPVTWKEEGSEIIFHYFSAAVLKSEKFLGNPELVKSSQAIANIPLGDILSTRFIGYENHCHTHFIFHLAYCCSTLLARYFEQSSHHLVMKEPGILASFSLKARGIGEREELKLATLVRLLGRVLPGQDLAIVKLNVFENILADELLRVDSSITATFIVQSLEDCLGSILKLKWRVEKVREWNRNIYRWHYHAKRVVIKPDGLDDVQAVAFWWIMNLKGASELLSAYPSRVLVLTADMIAERPEDVLVKHSNLPGMSQLEDRITEMLSNNVAQKYSKQSNKAYDSQSRKFDLEESLSKFETQALIARQWLEVHFGDVLETADRLARVDNSKKNS